MVQALCKSPCILFYLRTITHSLSCFCRSYADTISDYGFGAELANYGEYSGAPSTEHTYEYAKTILSLMTRTKHPKGKLLLIGGGIASEIVS